VDALAVELLLWCPFFGDQRTETVVDVFDQIDNLSDHNSSCELW
jgi:hypothetical protein